MAQSGYERDLCWQIQVAKLPAPETQYRFAPPRRWTVDLCWLTFGNLVVEVEGGHWIPGGGRHNRASGFEKDMEKYNELALRGFRLLRVTPKQVKDGTALNLVERALRASGEAEKAS